MDGEVGGENFGFFETMVAGSGGVGGAFCDCLLAGCESDVGGVEVKGVAEIVGAGGRCGFVDECELDLRDPEA